MKLYGTIVSDRATKSQGGNKELRFTLCVGSKTESKQVIEVGAYAGDDGIVYISVGQPHEHFQEYQYNLKGEKQKGRIARYCEAITDSETTECDNIATHGRYCEQHKEYDN